MSGDRQGRGFAMLVATGIIWGTIGAGAKLAYEQTDLDAVSVTWLRTVLATPVCLLLGWRAHGASLLRPSRHDGAVMTLLGAILIVYQWCYLAGVDRLGISAATLIALCIPPVLVALASTVVHRERLAARTLAALVGALVGTLLLVGWHDAGRAGSGSVAAGVVFSLGCAAGVALHVLVSRFLAGRQPTWRPLTFQFAIGAVVFLPLVLARGVSLDLSLLGWAIMLYLAVVPSVAAYWLYQRGLRDVSATMASIVTLLEPLTAALIAWIAFEERLTLLGVGGGLLLLAAIGLLMLPGHAPSPSANLDAVTEARQSATAP